MQGVRRLVYMRAWVREGSMQRVCTRTAAAVVAWQRHYPFEARHTHARARMRARLHVSVHGMAERKRCASQDCDRFARSGFAFCMRHGGAPQLLGRFQADDSWISPVSRGGAHVCFQNDITAESLTTEEEWDSELEFEGDIEPMEGLTDSDPDSWQDVTNRK